MLRFVCVCILIRLTWCTRLYSVHRTTDEYIIQVHKSLGRLKARMNDENTLHIFDQSPLHQFSRKWSLPEDVDTSKAMQYSENVWFVVRVPRVKTPELVGGEYERGTRIDLPSEYVCVTFDGSHPKCGSDHQCDIGERLGFFLVSDDEMTVHMVDCTLKEHKVQEAIFHSYDTDIQVEDLPDDPHKEDTEGVGWYDVRLKKVRYY